MTLTKDPENFSIRIIKAGEYAGASKVVRDVLGGLGAKEDPVEIVFQESGDLLLPAVHSGHQRFTAGHSDASWGSALCKSAPSMSLFNVQSPQGGGAREVGASLSKLADH